MTRLRWLILFAFWGGALLHAQAPAAQALSPAEVVMIDAVLTVQKQAQADCANLDSAKAYAALVRQATSALAKSGKRVDWATGEAPAGHAMTWADLGVLSLRRLGYLQPSEVPTAEDAAHVFQTLQLLINAMGVDRLSMHEITRTTWTLVSGDGSYSVGTGGDVNIARPVFVQAINFVDTSQDPDLEMPLGLLTDDAYQAIPQKAMTAVYPQYAYYNPTYGASGLATLTLWQVPTSTTLLGAIYAATAVVEPTSTAATISLPPGYLRYLRDNLAVEVAPDFEAVVTPELAASARDSKADVERANIRLADLYVDTALAGRPGGGKSNIFTGNV